MKIRTFIALFLFTGAALADTDMYRAELDALASKDKLNELILRVNQPRSPDELRTGLTWLREKSISGFGGARIHYSYALGLFGSNAKETATFAYMLGLLTGRVDAARCKDPSAPGEKLQRWDKNLAPITKYFWALPIDKRKELTSLAVVIEEKNRSRAPDNWLCSDGLGFMQKYFEKHGSDTTPTPRESHESSNWGKTILLEDNEIKPDFVTDEEWRSRRDQLVHKFVATMTEAY